MNMISIGGIPMFCRSCGNQLADNAKFCNRCGAKVAPKPETATPPPVIPDSVPVPPPAPAPAPISEPGPAAGNDFFQKEQPVYKPYEPAPAYQQPAPQPYPAQNAFYGNEGAGKMGRFAGLAALLFALAAFMISSPFLHMYGDSKYSFGSFSYLFDMSKAANKNIFSMSIDAISKGSGDTVLFFLALWVNILFEVCALIFLIIAFIGLFSSRKDKPVKVLGNIRVSISLSLIGFIISFGLMIASYLQYGKFSNIFKDVFYVFAYVFLGVAILSIILACIFVGQAKKENEVKTSYQQPVPPQPFKSPYN